MSTQCSAIQDFEAFLLEMQIDRSLMESQIQDQQDQAAFPPGHWKVEVKLSPLHGLGLFATADIEPFNLIAPARCFGKRTPAGRYTNHHPVPNAEALASGHDILFVSGKAIKAGEEIFVDYRQVLAVNMQTVHTHRGVVHD